MSTHGPWRVHPLFQHPTLSHPLSLTPISLHPHAKFLVPYPPLILITCIVNHNDLYCGIQQENDPDYRRRSTDEKMGTFPLSLFFVHPPDLQLPSSSSESLPPDNPESPRNTAERPPTRHPPRYPWPPYSSPPNSRTRSTRTSPITSYMTSIFRLKREYPSVHVSVSESPPLTSIDRGSPIRRVMSIAVQPRPAPRALRHPTMDTQTASP